MLAEPPGTDFREWKVEIVSGLEGGGDVWRSCVSRQARPAVKMVGVEGTW